MSIATVAKKDLKNVRRSRGLWVIATVLTIVVSVYAFSYEGYMLSPVASFQHLFRLLTLPMGLLLPIIALVASYLAIAGERRGGGIKFLLSLPNTRRDVFMGKLGSRLLLVVVGLSFAFLAITSAAASRQGVLPVETVLGVFLVSVLYASVFVCIAIALSAGIATRSRAIASSIGAYFVLIILFVEPNIQIARLIRLVHVGLLDFTPNQNLYDAVTYLSPYVAYQKAINLVFPTDMERQLFYRDPETTTELPAYLSDEFSLVIFSAWLVIPLVLGYLRFNRTDLE